MTSLRSCTVPAAVLLGILFASPSPLDAQAAFIRGDFNQDGSLDIADPVRILVYMFGSSIEPGCPSAGDADDSGAIEIADAVVFLEYLFLAGSPPAAPFPGCGPDPTPDSLGCGAHPPCAPADLPPVIEEWRVPYANSRPRDPYVDGLGRVWFVGQNADYAAYLIPESGEFTRFDLPAGAGPHNLIVNDRVWYSGNTAANIGRLDPANGRIDLFPMPLTAARDPHTLVFDQAGDIWFTVQNGNFVGKLTTASGQVRLIPVPTSGSKPYGIVVDSLNRPWFVEFGTNKLATIDTAAFTIQEFTLPRSGARPRRIEVTSDDAIWYVDYALGYLGRFIPATRQIREWLMPGGASSRPYGMAVDHRDRIWFVETGGSPNRFIGFNPSTEKFFGATPIPSGAGTVRHMYFHPPTREVWFGTDANTIGRARVE